MIGLFFGGKRFNTVFGNEYGNIELDANLEETHEWQAEATSNPVEEGAPITDHVIDMSDKIRIRGLVSDAPVESLISGAGLSRVAGIFNGKTLSNKTQPIFDALHLLIKKREPVTVYTKHRVYTDMILTNVNIPRAANVGEAIEFTAEFINIRKVSTQLVNVPKGISQKKEAKAGGKNGSTSKKTETAKDSGKKEPKELTSAAKSLKSGGDIKAKLLEKIGIK